MSCFAQPEQEIQKTQNKLKTTIACDVAHLMVGNVAAGFR
jgi:hypothetical protein